MGCCTTRMKVDEHTSITDFQAVNVLPTYQNVKQTYDELHLPTQNMDYIPHRKESMIYMIVNMIRHKPKLYLHALSLLQDRCSQRQTPHNLSFRVEDVSYAIEMLSNMEARQPLYLAEDLCEYSKNLLHSKDTLADAPSEQMSAAGDVQSQADADESTSAAIQNLKSPNSQPQLPN